MKMRMRLKMGIGMLVFWRELRDSYLALSKKRDQQSGARLTMACFTLLSWHMAASKIIGEAVAMRLQSAWQAVQRCSLTARTLRAYTRRQKGPNAWVIASRRVQMRAYTRRRCVPSLHALRRSARWCHAASVRGHGGPRSLHSLARRPQGQAQSPYQTAPVQARGAGVSPVAKTPVQTPAQDPCHLRLAR